MPTIITTTTIASAKAAAQPGAARYDVSDARAPGLVLRVSPRGVIWGLRYEVHGKSHRVVLGDVDSWTIAEARALAHRAIAMVRDRISMPDAEWVERQRKAAGKIAEATLQPAVSAPARSRDVFAWTFAEGRAKYLEDRARSLRPDSPRRGVGVDRHLRAGHRGEFPARRGGRTATAFRRHRSDGRSHDHRGRTGASVQ